MGTIEQRAAIKAILQSADPTALVHDYERWTNDLKTYQTFFQPAGDRHLKAWVFAPESEQDVPFTHDGDAHLTVWRVRFLASMVDGEATEKAALATVEAAQRLIRQNPTLNRSCFSSRPTLGPFADQVGLVVEKWSLQFIGPALCHLADARLVTED
jgi:hypothetical protein